MTATLTQPVHAAVPVSLPRLGLCSDCPDEIRIRGNGRLYAHGCSGDGTVPLLVLRPTFARWLWAQSKRRDERSNPLTGLAARQFRGCTRAPKLDARDQTWSTADELHGHLHLQQFARTGSDLRQPYNGERCDWVCRDLETAAGIYARLIDGEAA